MQGLNELGTANVGGKKPAQNMDLAYNNNVTAITI